MTSGSFPYISALLKFRKTHARHKFISLLQLDSLWSNGTIGILIIIPPKNRLGFEPKKKSPEKARLPRQACHRRMAKIISVLSKSTQVVIPSEVKRRRGMTAWIWAFYRQNSK
jgi:hypothetical protein